jgi:hypothetical protein
MIIALIIFGYLVVGFCVAMIYTFVQKRLDLWDHYADPSFCVAIILFYPILIPAGIVIFIIEELKEFFEWFAYCINEKET